jgi:hypothetical protein
MYPAVVRGGDSVRRKLRLCPGHFDTYTEMLGEYAQPAQDSFVESRVITCFVCHAPVDYAEVQLFVTVYPLKAERQDYWAPIHGDCGPQALREWQLTATMTQ